MSEPRANYFALNSSVKFPDGITDFLSFEDLNASNSWQPQVGRPGFSYEQKVSPDQQITILVHTQANDTGLTIVNPPKLFICDVNKLPIGGLNVAPIYKGTQYVVGNTIDMQDGSLIPAYSSCWSFNFTQLQAYLSLTDPLPGGVYYLRLTNIANSDPNFYQFSEPIFMSNVLTNTVLLESWYNANNQQKGIVNGRWYDDYPTNTVPYEMTFQIRVEGFLNQFVSKAWNQGYLTMLYQQLQITNGQITTRTLSVGELCQGIPYYMIQKLTEFLLADNLEISVNDRIPQKWLVWNPSGQSTPADMWKLKDGNISPLVKGSVGLVWKTESQNAYILPPPILGGRIFTGVFDGTFD